MQNNWKITLVRGLVLMFLATLILPVIAQIEASDKSRPLVISVFNTGSKMPGSGVLGIITTPLHPGISLGTEFRYNKDLSNQWFQTANLGFFHHRLAQTAIQLYTEAGYRRIIGHHLGAELRLGGGYLHAIPAIEVFEWKEGIYQKNKAIGRPMGMVGGTLGFSYLPDHSERNLRYFLAYQFTLQMPFVREYVPMLPYTSVHIGAAIPLFH